MRHRRIRRWLYRRYFERLVAEQVSLTLIRWRAAGTLDDDFNELSRRLAKAEQERDILHTEVERLGAVCSVCDHEWRRHDPEDGKCDAPGLLASPPTCFCGREGGITAWQARNAARSRLALTQPEEPTPRLEGDRG